ncbi:MAG: hypothetical protein Q9174_000312 [Haloplaca sp. 1 TL-2023]
MNPASAAKAPRVGLSLYANLLDPQNAASSAPGTISRAPVVFKQPAEGTEGKAPSAEKVNAADFLGLRTLPSVSHFTASLRFQPTKRPQVSAQKTKSKITLQKPGLPTLGTDRPKTTLGGEFNANPQPASKSTLSEWAAEPDEDDVNGFYAGEKRQRGGRKKRKKNKEVLVVHNWDDIYDPSRPNSYEEYQNSDEKLLEIREWKDRLYAHRMVDKGSDGMDSSSDDGRSHRFTNVAAPSGMSFAPPIHFGSEAPSAAMDDATGDRVHARGLGQLAPPRNTHGPKDETIVAPPPSSSQTPPQSTLSNSAAPPRDDPQSGVPDITRAPVRYSLPLPPADMPGSGAEIESALRDGDVEPEEPTTDQEPRSLRPGQKGFAQRLMSKYGWTKGSGLGASGTGIVNPLRVQVEKQKKKPDSEGGGFVGPGGRGKIIGGKKPPSQENESNRGKFGVMSEVIVLHGMVDGLDLDAEMERADGGLLQEIGDECGDKYGRVERVFIDRDGFTNTRVFVRFTSQLSALRAVNALEGRIFNGNAITARFYDCETFDAGIYT